MFMVGANARDVCKLLDSLDDPSSIVFGNSPFCGQTGLNASCGARGIFLEEFYLAFRRKNIELIDRLAPNRMTNRDAVKSTDLAAEVKCLTMDDAQKIWSNIDANARKEEPRDLLATIYYLADRLWICLDDCELARPKKLYPKSMMEVAFFKHTSKEDAKTWIEAATDQFKSAEPVIDAGKKFIAVMH